MAQRRSGILLRIRGALFGRGGGTTATSAFAAASRIGPEGSVMPAPGPFDQPPPEPVVLDPETLPWELGSAEHSQKDK